jgi:hypothetical protein
MYASELAPYATIGSFLIAIVIFVDKFFPDFRVKCMGKFPQIARFKWAIIFFLIATGSGAFWYYSSFKNTPPMFVRGMTPAKNNYGDDSPSSHVLIFYVEVFNKGKPSILRDWQLTIIGLDKNSTKADFFPFQNMQVPIFQNDPKDSIYEKTQSNPIPTGGEQYGYVLFTVQNLERTYMQIPGTIFEITFKDIDGNNYTNDCVWPLPNAQPTP